MNEQFVSQPIKPVISSIDTRPMAFGAPSVPGDFIWKGKTIHVLAVLKTWHTTGCCRHGSGERYRRRFWYEVETNAGRMKLYFDKASPGRYKEMGWCLYSHQPNTAIG